MQPPKLSQARMFLVENAFEPELLEELNDIIVCAPSRVAAKIRAADYQKLSKFIQMPHDGDGNIVLKGAREVITHLLNSYPSFRSNDPTTVCLAIAGYFTAHPEQSNATSRYQEIDWMEHVTPTNSANTSPLLTRNIGQPMNLSQEQVLGDTF